MAILTKLLLIRMVASRLCGLSLSAMMRRAETEFSSESFSKSLWDKEKKATSDPDMSAEHTKSSAMKVRPRKNSIEGATNRSKG